MSVVNVRVANLRKLGYNSLVEWLEEPNHIYIGRHMVYIQGTYNSKWRNPYPVKKYGREKCLEMYENYFNSTLIHDISELDGKVLGCWCDPEPCHGHILLRELKKIKQS